MSSLKKNGIALLGWLVLFALNYLFNLPLTAWVLQMRADFQLDDLVVVAILFPARMVLGFLAFAISFHGMVFPVLRLHSVVMDRSKISLLSEWILCCIVLFFFSWPLSLIQILLSFTGMTPAVIRMVATSVQIFASFAVYREVVMDHLKRINEPLEDMKIQLQETV